MRPRTPAQDSEAAASISPRRIVVVDSPLTDVAAAPNQGDKGAPEAWLELDASLLPALDGVTVGDELIVIAWLDQARRDVLLHPRGDYSRPEQGVFSTRCPHRPNPIGLHWVQVSESNTPLFRYAAWKPWTGRRSWTSSRC